ncbi:superoxide dismutase [Shimazuella sp. AN120528]|uniref:superoxide dismutase n=1 Tax=Shimazuella soli TaxID=1892854 RepID=UPI001F0D6B09|nr:superoxide dismutase [Shimazuella soli]MCH5584520.1 superoxide dismutase [Shimazuella soli]
MSHFTLPALPFSPEALEPHIDKETMLIHHGKHHQTYVDKLNEAIAAHPELADKSLEELLQNINELPVSIQTAVQNNGGGHYNHSLFWEILTPGGSKHPVHEIAKAIDDQFTNFDAFQNEFTKAALGRFGSGWVWLVADENGLEIVHTPNQDNPLMTGKQVILGLDVWEHAYYLRYQNKRPDYVAAFFQVINWDIVNEKYKQIRA